MSSFQRLKRPTGITLSKRHIECEFKTTTTSQQHQARTEVFFRPFRKSGAHAKLNLPPPSSLQEKGRGSFPRRRGELNKSGCHRPVRPHLFRSLVRSHRRALTVQLPLWSQVPSEYIGARYSCICPARMAAFWTYQSNKCSEAQCQRSAAHQSPSCRGDTFSWLRRGESRVREFAWKS